MSTGMRTVEGLTEDQLAAARRLGAATLHEAAGRIGAFPAAIGPIDDAFTVAGPALPVSVEPGDNLLIHQAVYEASPGAVLVVATNGGHEYGYWGEILTAAAQARRVAGLVIDGGARDVLRLRERGFPVFSRGRAIRGTSKEDRGAGSIGRPILLGDVLVAPGDLIVADADGVVSIPAGHAASVIELGESRVRKEDDHFARLAGGETTLDLYHLERRS